MNGTSPKKIWRIKERQTFALHLQMHLQIHPQCTLKRIIFLILSNHKQTKCNCINMVWDPISTYCPLSMRAETISKMRCPFTHTHASDTDVQIPDLRGHMGFFNQSFDWILCHPQHSRLSKYTQVVDRECLQLHHLPLRPLPEDRAILNARQI